MSFWFATGFLISSCVILSFADCARPLLSLNTCMTRQNLYSHRFNELSKRILLLSVFAYVLLTPFWFQWEKFLRVHLFQIKSTFVWVVLRFYLFMVMIAGCYQWSIRIFRSLREMVRFECCEVFCVVTYCCQGSYVESLLYKTHWVPRQWGFAVPRLQSWLFCNFEQAFHRYHGSVGILEDYTSKRSFSELSHFQS